MQRQEIPNHTPEQVHDHIAQALVILDAFELTADERAQLLPHVFVMLGGKQIVMAQFAPGGIALPQGAAH
jgi:hypothetical protein